MATSRIRVADIPFEESLSDRLSARHADDVSLYWLGQAGFVLVYDQRYWLIDPYLSDSLAEKYAGTLFPHVRMMSAPIAVSGFPALEGVLCTHRHTDHMDPGTLNPLFALPQQARAYLVAPHAERQEAAARSGLSGERIISVIDGVTISLSEGVRMTAIPAAHEHIERDEAGHSKYLGYVVELAVDGEPIKIWHSGDCVPYPALSGWLNHLKPDIALLPVNGRDDYRKKHGVPGNFTLEEAVNLCIDAGIPHMVAHHVGLFDFNTENPARIAAYAVEKADMISIWPAALNREYRLGLI